MTAGVHSEPPLATPSLTVSDMSHLYTPHLTRALRLKGGITTLVWLAYEICQQYTHTEGDTTSQESATFAERMTQTARGGLIPIHPSGIEKGQTPRQLRLTAMPDPTPCAPHGGSVL